MMILLMQNNKDGISFKKAEGQTIILLDNTFVWIFAINLPDEKGISFICLSP